MSNASDFIIENGVLVRYEGSGGTVTIPEGVTEIGENAFAQCAGLTEVILSDTVKTVGISSFFWCRQLERVQLGKHTEKLDLFAFSCCDQLKEITIPESVRVIETQVFGECSLQKVLILGADVQLSSSAFKGNGNWLQLCAPKLSLELIPKDNKWNAAIGFLQLWTEATPIAPEITAEYEAYIKRMRKKLLDEYVLRYRKEYMLQYFTENKLIKKTEIDELIQKTQRMEAPELTAVLMTYLNSEFGTGFEKTVERETAKEQETARKAAGKEKQEADQKNPASSIKKLWTVKQLPDGTCRLTGYKGKLEELIVPETVDGHSVSEIGNRDDCMANQEGYRLVRSISLPTTLRSIGRNAFAGMQVETVTIPEGVEKLGKRCFAGCRLLKTVRLPKTLKEPGDSLFSGCVALEEVNIPAGIRQIGKDLFDFPAWGTGCPQLKHVYIEGNNTSIEEGTFSVSLQEAEDNGAEKVTIHAPAGSLARTYAEKHDIPFVAE